MSNPLLLQTGSQFIRSSLKRDNRRGAIAEKYTTQGATIALKALPFPSEGKFPHPSFFSGRKVAEWRFLWSLLIMSTGGDYLIPCLVLSEPPEELTEPITRYGAMRRRFLKENRAITYSRLLLSERLFPHLQKSSRSL